MIWFDADFILFMILFALFIYVFVVNQLTVLHKLYLAFHFCMMLWPLGHFLATITTEPSLQMALVQMSFVGLCFVGFGWLWFTYVLVHGVKVLKWGSVLLTSLPLLLSTTIVVTNARGAFFTAIDGGFITRQYGPLFWVVIGVSAAYCLSAFLCMARAIRHKQGTMQRKQLTLFATGIAVIVLFALADILLNVVLDPIEPVKGLVSAGLILSDLCFVVAIQRYNVLEIIEVATKDVIHHMSTGMVVVDTQGIVLETNLSLQRYMTVQLGEPLMPEQDPLLEGESELSYFVRYMLGHPHESREYEYSYRQGEIRHIHIQVSPIHSHRKQLLGQILSIQDVTELRSLIRKLNSKNAELYKQNEELTLTQKELFLANQRLEEMAITDGLTGCFNRRYLNQYLEREIMVSHRYSRTFSLLLFDIDLFKNINDTYGHLIGDEVLRSTAKAVQDCLRQSDMMARYGGEEFTIYLPETDEQDGMVIAQRICSTVESNQVATKRGAISVTISMGMTVCRENSLSTEDPKEMLDTIFSRADAALYQAKQAGRNRIIAG